MAARPTLHPDVIELLVGALAADRVITDVSKVDEFRDPYWIAEDDTYVAAAVVEPTTTEEVQAVMRIASAHGINVWPHGQGKNNGYGGPSPRVAGSLQISLRKMNRVLEINEDLAYAVVEPGVSWFDLYEAIKAGGHSLQLSVPDLGWGSVIGNSMDNGMTYMPYGADFQLLCGLEVVLPDGELLRTGMGAIPDNKTWHLYRRGLGPTVEQLFAQSNYGIVVRAGVWLQRKPEGYITLGLSIGQDADLEAAVDALRELRLTRILEGVPSMYTALTAAPQLNDADVEAGDKVFTDDELQAYADRTGVGAWMVRSALWGTKAIVEAKLEEVKRVWGGLPSGKVMHSRTYSPADYPEMELSPDQIQAGIPTLQLIEAQPPWLGHIGFSPIVPLVGEEVRFVVDQIRSRLREDGLNFLGGVFAFNERTACVVTGIPFDIRDKEQTERAYRSAKRLVQEIGELGYGEYRAHLDFMDPAQEIYSWNDHAYRRFAERLKDAIDPAGVLSPGRHGIWPAKFRDASS
jgi:4-cresol dehydrogenase (hydroxylating)